MHLIRKLAIASVTIIALLAMWSIPAFAKTATPTKSATHWTTVPLCAIHTPPPFTESGLGPTFSSVAGVVYIECRPVYSEYSVTITADELYSRCNGTLSWFNPISGPGAGSSFTVYLDNDGNAEASFWGGPSCAAGTSTICASLNTAPFPTECAGFTILPPHNTPPGVKAIPSTEIEDSILSSVETVIYVEFPSYYSERYVTITSQELYAACATNLTWIGPDEVPFGAGPSTTVQLDNNGNAFVVAEAGPSCASGTYTVEASLIGAPYTTYLTHFTILSPRPSCTKTSCH
jgi:hypothetical protein